MGAAVSAALFKVALTLFGLAIVLALIGWWLAHRSDPLGRR